MFWKVRPMPSRAIRGAEMVNVLIFEGHPSFLGPIKSIDAIEDARFPSPVGSDDGQHLSSLTSKLTRRGSDTSKFKGETSLTLTLNLTESSFPFKGGKS
jgi:hypothetical protein